jgi:hypothetical protein
MLAISLILTASALDIGIKHNANRVIAAQTILQLLRMVIIFVS